MVSCRFDLSCCDRGVYIGRIVAGIIFCWFSFFRPQWRLEEFYVDNLVFGAAAAVGSRLGMPSGYACPCCAFRGLRP